MTRAELEDFTKFIMSPNSRQATNGQFIAADVTAGVQRAYAREWNKFRAVATRSQVVMSTTFTWSAGEPTLTLPQILRDRTIHSIYDITDSPDGMGMRTVFYVDNLDRMLRWPSTVGASNTGPFRDTLLRAFFMPHAEKLEAAESTPRLIPTDHHQLLGWSAAVELLEIANGATAVPTAWRDRLTDLQTDYWQECKVPVVADRARILPDDAVDFFYLGAV